MQKSKGNMYADWVTHTSNPIKGECKHNCSYCYMHAIQGRYGLEKLLRLYDNELSLNYGSGKTIFIGSSTDAWADNVPSDWIRKVYDHCELYPENNYLLQSKNPNRFFEFMDHHLMTRKDYLLLATTIESNRSELVASITQAPPINERVYAMTRLRELGYKVIITMEPVMDFDVNDVIAIMRTIEPFQLNIGCNTNRGVILPEPEKTKLLSLISSLHPYTNIVLKANMSRILNESLN